MDTLENIPVSKIDNSDLFRVADLTEGERKQFENFVALTRDVQEAHQLFEVFYFNLLNMRNVYEFKTSGKVIKKGCFPKYNNEFIAVNSLVISLISSAKVLTEFLRQIADKPLNYGKTKEGKCKDEYNTYVSEIYDSCFSYRLLINLRNYVQHGYLPVSHQKGYYRFDIEQILDTPHFEINAQLKKDLDFFIVKMSEIKEESGKLSLVYTLAEFTVNVVDIYKQFLVYIEQSVSLSYDEIKKIIKDKPHIVCDYNEPFRGYVFYSIDDMGRCHTVNPNNNPIDMLDSYKERTSSIYKYEKNGFDDLKKSIIIYDEKR